MKKLIGILGIAMIAMAMFFNANSINQSSIGDFDLASLLAMNTANAECNYNQQMQYNDCEYFCTHTQQMTCSIFVLCSNGSSGTVECVNGDYR